MPRLMAQASAHRIVGKAVGPTAQVVPLRPPRPILPADATRCPKCDSAYVTREPAFLHCRFCGNMARLASSSSLLDQEIFERRSGLRIAS
jgi:hypothetical protein